MTRKKTPCQAPAIAGCARCRMHGGKGSGPPEQNMHAFKHGRYTVEALAMRKQINTLLREGRKLIREM